MWISPEFKIYLIKEFQRLKDQEREQLGWDIRRNLTRINYRIHTDAIKENLIPPQLSKAQTSAIYAGEADVLNMALFGSPPPNGGRQIRAEKEISGITPRYRNWSVCQILKISMHISSVMASLRLRDLRV